MKYSWTVKRLDAAKSLDVLATSLDVAVRSLSVLVCLPIYHCLSRTVHEVHQDLTLILLRNLPRFLIIAFSPQTLVYLSVIGGSDDDSHHRKWLAQVGANFYHANLAAGGSGRLWHEVPYVTLGWQFALLFNFYHHKNSPPPENSIPTKMVFPPIPHEFSRGSVVKWHSSLTIGS